MDDVWWIKDDGWLMDKGWGTVSAERLITAELRQYHLLLDQIFYEIRKNTWNTEVWQRTLSAELFVMMGDGPVVWALYLSVFYDVADRDLRWMGSDILQSKEDWRLKTEELENFVLCYRILPYKIPYLIAYPKSKTVFLDNIRVETFYPLITSQQSIEKNRFSFFRRENSSEDQVTCKEKFIWSDTNICRGIRSFTNRSLPMVTAGSKSNLRTDASHTYFHMYYLPNSVSVQRPRGDHWGSSMSRLWRKYLER